jgi:nucleotide-binding universal stress UspA family protein
MDAGSGEECTRRDVVVGVDGSADALRAVRWAAHEARLRSAPLRLVAAHEPVGDPGGAHRTSEHRFGEVRRRTAAEAVAVAAAVVAEVAPEVEVRGRTGCGRPVDVLRDESRSARLLVVGDRGRGRLEGTIAGSVAAAVVIRANCPVVVVRGSGSADADGSPRPVVLGVDGSATSEAATEFAFAAATVRGAPLIAVHTWWDPVLGPAVARLVDIGAIESDERRRLVSGWRGGPRSTPMSWWRPWSRATSRPDLLRRAAQAQLLVVGSRGHGELAGLVLGSVSNAVVHPHPCPVAVVRPDASGRV